jgi:hypothetical protein
MGSALVRIVQPVQAAAVEIGGAHSAKATASQIKRPSSSPPSTASGRYSLAVPRPTERRVACIGHIAVLKNGSPIQRKPVARKINPHDVRGLNALSQKGKSRLEEAAFNRFEKQLLLEKADAENAIPQNVEDDKAAVAESSDASSGAEQEGCNYDDILKDYTREHNDSPQSFNDTPTRRSAKFSVGASVRYANDAHEVIMGDGSARYVTSIEVCCHQLINGDSASTASRKILNSYGANGISPHPIFKQRSAVFDAERVAVANSTNLRNSRGASSLPARNSLLQGSPEEFEARNSSTSLPKKASFTSRLARPTAASQARETASKNSILKGEKQSPKTSPLVRPYVSKSSPKTPLSDSKLNAKTKTAVTMRKSETVGSMKKFGRGSVFKSRLAAILPGRRRATESAQSPINKSNISNAKASKESIVDTHRLGTKRSSSVASRNLTTYKNSGMKKRPDDVTRVYPSGVFGGEPTDKLANEREELARDEFEYRARQANPAPTAQASLTTVVVVAQLVIMTKTRTRTLTILRMRMAPRATMLRKKTLRVLRPTTMLLKAVLLQLVPLQPMLSFPTPTPSTSPASAHTWTPSSPKPKPTSKSWSIMALAPTTPPPEPQSPLSFRPSVPRLLPHVKRE